MTDLTIDVERGEHVEFITFEAVRAIGYIPDDIMLEHLRHEHPDVTPGKTEITYYKSAHIVKVRIPWHRIRYTPMPWTVS